ncbi:hypothetical protein IJ596_04515 [bacterium]|nr:hypothetical protein [bacterium]
MKKLILLLGLMLFTAPVSFGAECEYTCVEPYDMSNKFSSFFSSITGLNFAKTQISESVLKKAILKSVQGDKNLKVDIDSYSAKDLSKGIFKSLSMSGKNINIDGIYLSSVELKSLCDFNYIQYDKKGNLTFKEDFPMSFELEMSADDINNTMKTEKYGKIVNDLNRLSFAGIKVSSTAASIRGNKFYYTINVTIPFVREPKKIEISADLNVKDGKIDFENTRLSSNSFNFDLKKIDFIMNYLNPLDFSINIFDNKNAKIYIKNISIKNNIIVTDGIVVVPKD